MTQTFEFVAKWPFFLRTRILWEILTNLFIGWKFISCAESPFWIRQRIALTKRMFVSLNFVQHVSICNKINCFTWLFVDCPTIKCFLVFLFKWGYYISALALYCSIANTKDCNPEKLVPDIALSVLFPVIVELFFHHVTVFIKRCWVGSIFWGWAINVGIVVHHGHWSRLA